MGDCRVRVLASTALLSRVFVVPLSIPTILSPLRAADKDPNRDNEHEDNDPEDGCASPLVLVGARTWSSDSTVREVVEDLSLSFATLSPSSNDHESDSRSVTTFLVLKDSSTSSTVRTDSEALSVPVLTLLEKKIAKLWDCTRHPPVDITSWPISLYPNRWGGLNSMTLYDAGWYPSGTLQVLPVEQEFPRVSSELMMNDPNPQHSNQRSSRREGTSTSQLVELRGSTTASGGDPHQRALPSHVLDSVTRRFEDDDNDAGNFGSSEGHATGNSIAAQKMKEEARMVKLEARIRQLEEDVNHGGKNQRVSEHVQRMLIKSRATGRPGLKVHDRFYLRCLVDDEPETTPREEYRYYSPQDTVGRILSSFSSRFDKDKQLSLALLVEDQQSRPASSQSAPLTLKKYRRLPVLSRMYELVASGDLSEFDKVFVCSIGIEDRHDVGANATRIGSSATTPGVSDLMKHDSIVQVEGTVYGDGDNQHDPPIGERSGCNDAVDDEVHQKLSDALSKYEDESSSDRKDKKKKKPPTAVRDGGSGSGRRSSTPSAASVRVRQMQMKGKARGDGKRIQNPDDRFYVELVTILADASSARVVDASPVFMSKSDPLGRLVRDCVFTNMALNALAATPTHAGMGFSSSSSSDWHVDLYAARSVQHGSVHAEGVRTVSFQPLADTSMTFHDAEKRRILSNFDRLLAFVQRHSS
jgi:hypothetical protein